MGNEFKDRREFKSNDFMYMDRREAKYHEYLERRESKEHEWEDYCRNEIFEMMVNRGTDIIILFTVGEDGNTADYVSPNIERLLGISAGELKGDFQRLADSAVGPDYTLSERALVEATLEKDGRMLERIHQKTGEALWFQERVLRGRFQDSKKFLLLMSDRTQAVKSHEQLEQALAIARSANEGKSNFLANMSHDIRTPMNAIIGFAHLLEQEWENPEKVQEYTRKISASSKHLLSLINDLLDMNRLESGKAIISISEFNISEFLEELRVILRPQLKAKKHHFEMQVKGLQTELLIADKARLSQILLNILTNAIKYTPEGGNISFTITQMEQTSRRFSHLQFQIADNGVGMSEEFQSRVFEPFAREKNTTLSGIAGTGLGLAIVKNLVDLMGGTIHVSSTPGKGSVFTVELELQMAAQEVNEGFWEELGICRMLSVDDEEDICWDIQQSMSNTGVTLDTANSGKTALEMVKQALLEGKPYDMILLDWKMPDMDGIETARRIREEIGGKVPILILTAYDWVDIEESARAVGVSGFLAKPFFITNFKQVVETLDTASDDQGAADVLNGLHILAAEDNELNAEILLELLSMEGAQCDLRENGKLAVELFEASAPGTYDVVLLDVQMPVMDGHETARAIRASSHPDAKRIPIAAMTANAFAEDVEAALAAGMDVHMAKPIDMEAMKIELFRLLKQKSGSPS